MNRCSTVCKNKQAVDKVIKRGPGFMGDTIPNCEFMHAHEEIIEKVNASMPDE